MSTCRLNVSRIAQALQKTRAAVKAHPRRWRKLRREKFSGEVVRNLIDGYRYVDRLLAEDVDLFAYGASDHLLELNHLVLCGTSQRARALAKAHMEQTREHFYEEREGGIGDFADWYGRNVTSKPRTLAAGSFLRIVSAPQLFIEGNQRTAALICSYILGRVCLPPVVATREDYQELFQLCAEIRAFDRHTLLGGFRAWHLQRRFMDLHMSCGDARFLSRGGLRKRTALAVHAQA